MQQPKRPITYGEQTAFRADLDRRIDAYFAASGLTRQDAPRMYAKTAVLALGLAATYAALVFAASTAWQAVPLAVALGVLVAGIGFNVQHDGGHRAYSRLPWVNRLMASSLDVVGGSSYFWNFKHNIAHHTYPNISGADDDIFLGALARMSPHDPRHRWHRFQHVYMWGLYALLAIKWHLVDDFRTMASPRFAYGETVVHRPAGWEVIRFWAGKLVFVAFAFVVPLSLHSPRDVVGLYLVAAAATGFVLGVVFQLAHCVAEADFPAPPTLAAAPVDRRMPSDFAAHQVATTVDFARDSRPLTWFLGGLNFQVEHHLYPKICHVHYAALAPIVEATCAEHGVLYRAHATLGDALRSHYRWLRRMGSPETSGPAATSTAAAA